MEIPPSRWSTAGRQIGARPYPKNELREPALGCAAYPRLASEPRLRRRPVDSLEVHGTEARSTIANVEDLPSQPVSYTHLRAHETRHDLVCRLLLEKKKKRKQHK